MTTHSAIDPFLDALLSMDRIAARRVLGDPGQGMAAVETVEHVIVPSLERVGELWERGEVSLAQIYMSGRICEELVDVFLPPSDPLRVDQPSMAIAVLDDYHLLGKRMVYAVVRASGYELKDYGTLDAKTLASRVIEDQIEVLLISVLMLHSALRIKETRAALEAAGRRPLIIVGGAPFRFDRELWREVGADAMACAAADAVATVRGLLGGRR